MMNEQAALEKLVARAFARKVAAEIALGETTARLAMFERCREDMPLLYRDIDGREITKTLRGIAPLSWRDRVGRYFTQADEQRDGYAAVQRAAVERHAQLIEDRNAAQAYHQAAHETADCFRQRLAEQGRELPAPHYTAKEIAAIEVHAAKQTNERLRAEYEKLVCAAISEGRVGSLGSGRGAGGCSKCYRTQPAEHSLETNQLAAEQEITVAAKSAFNIADVGQSVNQGRDTSRRGVEVIL